MTRPVAASFVRRTDPLPLLRVLPGLYLLLAPDADFTIVGASDAYLRATFTDASIFGRPLFEVFPADPRQRGADGAAHLGASLRRVLATRAPDAMPIQRYDVRAPGSDRFLERYWAPINRPVLGEDGQVEFILHQVEDASATGDHKAVAILESITEGFFTLDRGWRFDFVNREAHRILDRQPGDLSGKVLWTEYPGLEGTEFERTYRRTMVERETGSFTAFYPGHQRWYEVTTFPAPEGVSVYFRNVTAQKNLEAERERLVRDSEQQRRIYETALDSTPDFVYVFDLQHRALYANGALLRTWGVDDVRGKVWMELGYEQWHADMHDRELDQVITTGAPIRGEIPFTGTGGRRIYDYIFAPVFGPDGAVVAVAGTTRDITDRKAGEQAVRDQADQLAQADRAKDEFLATLSHELRNPLAPLRNSLALLRLREGETSPSAAIHQRMERQLNQLVRLVDDLLELSRISGGTLTLRKERIELAAVVRSALETAEPQIRAAGHALALDLPSDPVWVDGDALRLGQILSNIVDNAAKYTPDGGHIAVRAAVEDGQAVVAVRDDGFGIAPEALSRLFTMFSRGGRDSERSRGGLGIGLALSQRLAQMHGGSLEPRSAGVGRGSEFVLRLPLSAGAQPPTRAPTRAPAPATAPSEAALAGARVLVVDDNRDAGDSLAAVLSLLGAQVEVAEGGAQALEVLPAFSPTVVLLDIGMPDMDGYQVAREIRSRFPGQPIRVVALTGWGQAEDRRRASEAGFDHHLVKPVEIDVLRQLLRSLPEAT